MCWSGFILFQPWVLLLEDQLGKFDWRVCKHGSWISCIRSFTLQRDKPCKDGLWDGFAHSNPIPIYLDIIFSACWCNWDAYGFVALRRPPKPCRRHDDDIGRLENYASDAWALRPVGHMTKTVPQDNVPYHAQTDSLNYHSKFKPFSSPYHNASTSFGFPRKRGPSPEGCPPKLRSIRKMSPRGSHKVPYQGSPKGGSIAK